jgi:cyclic dehypoxanthinyl futalosine synthase
MSIASAATDIRPILEKALEGKRISFDEGWALMNSNDILLLGQVADELRRRKHPQNYVSYVIDRNVNYTNVCAAQCSFCAFKRDVGSPEGYVLPDEVFDQKIAELAAIGGTQVLLQGGLNPALPLSYYQDLIRRVQTRYPQITVHGFSPSEVWFLAKLNKMTVYEVLGELKAAGLKSIPGGGGEILVDRVRRQIGKGKVLTDQWFEVMEAAQQHGMNTSATMMYGHIETLEERMIHLDRIRQSGDKYGGYRAFIHWDFQPDNTPLGLEVAANPDYHLGTGWEYLKLMALARIYLDNIDNLQVSWVTMGPKLAQVALQFGANDYGGTMMEENVVSAAGTRHMVGVAETVRQIETAGYTAVQRDTFYNVLKVHERSQA